jgi:Ca2+/Na+ antiporter
MDQIRDLARFSVLRASGFSVLAVALVMLGTAHDLAASFRYGAAGLLVLALALAYAGLSYHRRRRIEETEVWIMMAPEDRPPKEMARVVITRAMRAELLEKALWAALGSLCLVALSALVLLFGAGPA